jgi:hypothetical protein
MITLITLCTCLGSYQSIICFSLPLSSSPKTVLAMLRVKEVINVTKVIRGRRGSGADLREGSRCSLIRCVPDATEVLHPINHIR